MVNNREGFLIPGRRRGAPRARISGRVGGIGPRTESKLACKPLWLRSVLYARWPVSKRREQRFTLRGRCIFLPHVVNRTVRRSCWPPRRAAATWTLTQILSRVHGYIRSARSARKFFFVNSASSNIITRIHSLDYCRARGQMRPSPATAAAVATA